MEDGSGLGGEIPPLAQADFLEKYADQVACIIYAGIEDTIIVNGKTYNQPMEGIKQLSPVEITNVINYINRAWGNDYGSVTLGEVKENLIPCTNPALR